MLIFVIFLQIVFEAVRGSGGDKGDIAIDDVSIKNGGCPNPGRLLMSIVTGKIVLVINSFLKASS